MSTQHIVHKILEPGLPGDGFTAPEAEVVRTKVDDHDAAITRVDPGTPGAAGQQLRVTVNGPRYLKGDVSPLMFDAVGNGSTDDYAAIMQAIDALGTRGGVVDLAGMAFRSNTPLTPTTPVKINGGVSTRTSGIGNAGKLVFPKGSNGLTLGTVQGQSVENLAIETDDFSSPGATGTGLTVLTASSRLDNLFIRGFDIGWAVLSGVNHGGGIASHGLANQVNVAYNRRGAMFDGSDSNVWQTNGLNASFNTEIGIYNNGLYQNIFIGAHTLNNGVADFYEDGWGTHWLNPYSEMGGKFIIGPGAKNGYIRSDGDGGGGGSPMFYYDDAGTHQPIGTPAGLDPIIARGMDIIKDGKRLTPLLYRSPINGRTYSIRTDAPNQGSFSLYDETNGNLIFTVGSGTGAGSFTIGKAGSTLGFYGKAGVVQPTLPAPATDLATALTLINAMRTAVINNGITK